MTSNAYTTQWQCLEPRPHEWRKQLFFKERRLRPSTVCSFDAGRRDDPRRSSLQLDWDLSLDEVTEAIAYCEANREVLKQDAEAERRYLEERGVILEPLNQSSVISHQLFFVGDKPVVC